MDSKRIPDFSACAARYIRGHRHGWQNAEHARQWVSTLKTFARPVIGKEPVNAITTEDILQILSPIRTTKTETAKQVQGRIENGCDRIQHVMGIIDRPFRIRLGRGRGENICLTHLGECA